MTTARGGEIGVHPELETFLVDVCKRRARWEPAVHRAKVCKQNRAMEIERKLKVEVMGTVRLCASRSPMMPWQLLPWKHAWNRGWGVPRYPVPGTTAVSV